jgi:hypothetical protein
MSGSVTTNATLVVHSGDALDITDLVYGVDCNALIPADSTLTGASVISVLPSGMTISSVQVPTETVTDSDGTTTIAANKGFVFVKTGGARGSRYEATFQVTTDGGSVMRIIVPIRVDG